MHYAIAALCVLCLALPAAAQNPDPSSTRPLTAGELRQLLKDSPDDRPVSLEEAYASQHAAADGGRGKANGDKLDQKFSSTPPGVQLPGGVGAQGGGTQSDQSAEVNQTTWFRVLLACAGLACVAGAGWKLYRVPPDLKTGAGLALGGATLLLCALYPSLIWLMLIAAALIAIPHFMPDKTKSALDALVDGLALSPHAAAVLPSIKGQATPADLAHIQETAAKNGNPINLS